MAELSKPVYQPLVFRPVTPTKKTAAETAKLGHKRLAFDGTEINVYNQSLYDNSVASSGAGTQRRNFKKIPRFGKKQGQSKL